MPCATRRSSAIAAAASPETSLIGSASVGAVRAPGELGELHLDRQEPLLRAVVEVALEPPPLLAVALGDAPPGAHDLAKDACVIDEREGQARDALDDLPIAAGERRVVDHGVGGTRVLDPCDRRREAVGRHAQRHSVHVAKLAPSRAPDREPERRIAERAAAHVLDLARREPRVVEHRQATPQGSRHEQLAAQRGEHERDRKDDRRRSRDDEVQGAPCVAGRVDDPRGVADDDGHRRQQHRSDGSPFDARRRPGLAGQKDERHNRDRDRDHVHRHGRGSRQR